jgi:hypothetical protein
VLGNLAPLLDHYGYLAIAGLISLEDSGVPAPDETVLITGTVYAGAGHLNIVAVVAIAVAAAVLGETSAMRSATSVGGRSCCASAATCSLPRVGWRRRIGSRLPEPWSPGYHQVHGRAARSAATAPGRDSVTPSAPFSAAS